MFCLDETVKVKTVKRGAHIKGRTNKTDRVERKTSPQNRVVVVVVVLLLAGAGAGRLILQQTSHQQPSVVSNTPTRAEIPAFKTPHTLAELEHCDIARINLLCAEGLSGAETLNVDEALAALDTWALHIKSEIDRNFHHYTEDPAYFYNSENFYKMAMMGVVLYEDYNMNHDLANFEGHEIRRLYDEQTETWWFSVVDIIRVLTQQADYQIARKYWNKLKERLNKEGSQLVTNCHQLKMRADDGKQRLTDVATAETLLRLVQSVPSPKAEPIKLWLAKVGYERMQEMADPARSLARARETWQKQGRSAKWIEQRMTGQETRNKLTDYWAGHDIKQGDEFAILTNIIHQEWAGVGVQSHKNLKGLKAENLRDHMSEAELIFTALAELSTRPIAESVTAAGMAENSVAAKTGERIARKARLELEAKTGRKVVTGENYLPPSQTAKQIR